ncbi:uncharacterized protein EV420DRAFT_1651573 [Desarmillaria tabescens]|uniref:DUF6534 domain-containing protein n=1 Tax=Armillaria tabescens TaxID=1929756 RepID=A0AA39JAG1_ARMTA|nr:uncharacterized protein EV420DRAFT_1651573 [Desarmillaria tabescens]KAK0438191.1 hypothetical protein EV420DRAFT_1651573 [Desarmillaria tabescens]
MTFGAVYIGVTIGAIFYGITIVQTTIYYKQYPNDPRLFRYAVALLCILDTLHVVTSTHVLYFYLVESFGNWHSLFRMEFSGAPISPASSIISNPQAPSAFSCNLYSMYVNLKLIVFGVQANPHSSLKRILTFSLQIVGRNFHVVLPYFIFLAVAASLATGTYALYDIYTLPSIFDIPTIRTAIYAVFSTFTVVDFFIAATMCHYLHKGRSMTSFSSTTKIIVGLMRLALIMNTGSSACSMFTLVAYIVWPNNFIYIAVDSILPKHAFYINSLLSMLNARNVQIRTGTKEYPVHQTILRLAPHTSGSRGESGLAEMSIDIALSVMEGGHSNACTEDMTLT